MASEELNKKVKKAIESNLVGEVIFSDEELNQLKNSIPYLHFSYDYIDVLTAEKVFVYITNLTKTMENDDGTHDNDWRNHIDPSLASISDLGYSATRIYELLKVVEKRLGDSVYFLPSVPGIQRYYGTFMGNALATKTSMFAFFDLCYNDIYRDVMKYTYYDDDTIYDYFAEAFQNSVKYGLSIPISSQDVTLDSPIYSVRVGLKHLALYDTKRMARLFHDVIYLFSILDYPEKFLNDNYLHQLVLEWYENKLKLDLSEIEQKERAQRENVTIIRKNVTLPSLHYALNPYSKHIYLVISSFFVSYSGDPRNIDLKYTLYKKGTPLKDPKDIPVNQRGFLFEASETRIDLNGFVDWDSHLDDSYIIITLNGKVILDSRDGSQCLDCDFMIFPMKNSNEVSETKKAILAPDYYYVYFSKGITSLINYPSEMERVQDSDSVYIIHPESGEKLSSQNHKILFMDQNEYTKPGFDVTKNDATYIYKGEQYEIIETLSMRLNFDMNIDGYSLAFYDMRSNTTKPFKNIPLRELQVYEDSDYKYKLIYIDTDIPEKIPFKVCLFKGIDRQIETTANVIFISGFFIDYLDDGLCFKDSINFRIYMRGETAIECVEPCCEEIKVEFLDGFIVLNNPAIFMMKIGKGDYKLLDEFETDFFYKNISSSDAISFLPHTLNFKVSIDDIEVNLSDFGMKIHSLANNKYKGKAEVKIYYYDEDNKWHEITEITIHYKPSFLVFPIIQVKEGDQYRVYWNPTLFIGDKNNCHFKLRFESIPHKSKDDIFKIDDTFTLEKKEIDVSFLPYRKYRCVVIVSGGLFATNENEITLGEFIYGDAGHAQLAEAKIFNQCICTTGTRSQHYKVPIETQCVLSQEYVIGDSTETVLSDGSKVYMGNLYYRNGQNYLRITQLGGCQIKSVVWKYDEDDKNKILLRYELEGEEYEEFCDYDQFIVFRYSMRLSLIKTVKPTIIDFDILESIYFKKEG